MGFPAFRNPGPSPPEGPDEPPLAASLLVLTMALAWRLQGVCSCWPLCSVLVLIGFRVLNFGEFSNGKAAQHLPPLLASHELEIADFESRCHQLCVKLLRLFAKGLKVCFACRIRHAPCAKAVRLKPVPAGRIGLLLGMKSLEGLQVACSDGFMYTFNYSLIARSGVN